MAEADIALIGLAVMGQNLIMNMNDHGFVVCAYNRTVSKVHDFLQNEAKGSKVIGAESLEDMVTKLKKPRRIILLVKAGQAVDDFIDKLAFDSWNKTELDSFLIEITANILKYKDSDGKHLLPKIRDSAGQKGTGKWTAISALEYGTPVTLIGEAVFARCLSSLKDERVEASRSLSGPQGVKFSGNKATFLEDIRKALYASKIISYAQGFMLLRQAANEFGWTLNYGAIALMWRGGCIIRRYFCPHVSTQQKFASLPCCAKVSTLLSKQWGREPLLRKPNKNRSFCCLSSFSHPNRSQQMESWRRAVSTGVQHGIPMPCFTTALSFYDGYRHDKLPANLLQAQRDYFGAHTYELLSNPGHFIHTNWTGHGGNVSSSSYNA
ncbi:6-phosphogluconate dehydrogenase, decarboxylating [Neolamprologus brichardi]|uniref:6-phosphogluconate dehydrogenase, decarboxylating n=1 Tax=Neolamprologus brichardi TaxID=32507 RepID=UPI0003EBDB72|nr:6-phosphogluconate dehydrogenase, decarboxylating [Neolamprologus brichardi]